MQLIALFSKPVDHRLSTLEILSKIGIPAKLHISYSWRCIASARRAVV